MEDSGGLRATEPGGQGHMWPKLSEELGGKGCLGSPEQGPGLCEDAAGSRSVWVLVQVPEMTGAQWPNWERAQFTGSQVEYSGRRCLGGQK